MPLLLTLSPAHWLLAIMQNSHSHPYDAYGAQPPSSEDHSQSNIRTSSEPLPSQAPYQQTHTSFYELEESTFVPSMPHNSDPHQQHAPLPQNSLSRRASTGGRVQGGQFGTQSQSFPGGVAQPDIRHTSTFYGPSYYPQFSANSPPHSPTLPYRNNGQPSHFIQTPSQVAAHPNFHNPAYPTTPSQHTQHQSSSVLPDRGNHRHPPTNAQASSSRHPYSSPLTSTPRPIRHADSGSTSHYRSHSATVASPMQGERYLCPYCHNTFSRAHDRKRHHETHHLPNPVAHPCSRCGKEFGRGDSLKRHTDNGCRDSEV